MKIEHKIDTKYKIDTDEYLALSRSLEQFHSVFQKFWEMGKPVFTTEIPTACVEFNRAGYFVTYLFNPEFYSSLTLEQKAFVIAHECLHVILNHGERSALGDAITANVALDLVVNHMLIRDFGMDRETVDPENKYCWVDTVFKLKVQDNLSYEHYYNLLKQNGVGGQPSLVDIHDNFGEGSGLNGDVTNDILEELSDLGEDAKETLTSVLESHFVKDEKHQGRGVSSLGALLKVQIKTVKKKKKWETIIQNWAKNKIKNIFSTFEHWARINRRAAMLPEDIILPSEMEMEDLGNENDKVFVYFFLDTSGSCAGYSQRFFNACQSLPTDKIEARFFSFDTQVYPAEIHQGLLYGGGGTSFYILEERIQQDIRSGELDKYPDGIFVLTDGYGDSVYPQYPEKWMWMMTHPSFYCIPQESKKYMLKDFE